MTLQAGAELCDVLAEEATKTKCVEAVAKLKQHVPDLRDKDGNTQRT